ncbi:transcript variant X2 [Nothobranchius furzeri]|uniref:Transcript variant X2 n=1 Tax=Nothobranchius furzeri TaxID=105023 RepID=A0A9D2XJ54_NOTFU|nr:transcript variant X2 [Nothobranchius furzeri]
MAGGRPEAQDHPPENGFTPLERPAPRLLQHIDGCVLPALGGFGKHQKQLVVLTWIPALFIGCSQFSDYFLLAQPHGTCVQPLGNDSNWTGSPLQPEWTSGAAAPQLKGNGTGEGFGDGNGMLCACEERRLELQTGLTQNVVTKWNLVCDSAWKVHIAKFSLLVGSIFGYLVMGVMADWFGRHPVLILSVLFMLVFGLSVAFSVNVTMFSTLRFFEGFCLAGLALSLYVLRIELCLPGWRFSMTMVASFLKVGGQLLMPAAAALCRYWPNGDDWQVLQIAIISPFVLMLPYVWIFQESLRWLLATQHYKRSKAMMLRIARKNQVDMTTERSEVLAVIGKYSLRHDTVLRDTLNRKFSVAFSVIGMFSSHAVSTLSIFFCAEITPTVIRGGGLGLVLASAGFGMLTAPIMELHNQKGYFLHHVIFACCTLLCIICLLLLPEPRGQPLPESLADGETFTRRPLLHPGEQHLLLAKCDRDYSRVHDTPLHLTATGGATVAVATALAAVPASYALATGGEVIGNHAMANGV